MAKQPIKPKNTKIEQIKKDFDNAMTPRWYKEQRQTRQNLNNMLSAYNQKKKVPVMKVQ